jgi:hypothetical protein
MKYNIQYFLDEFNNGKLDVEKYFNDYETFFNVLKRKNLFYKIDPINGSGSGNWQNEYILWSYENNKEKYYNLVTELLNDVEYDPQNNKFFWIGDREDLTNLFCDDSRDISQNTIKKILRGFDIDAYFYGDTTDDLYHDVIDKLNLENINILKNKIIEELEGTQLSPETEEMESIASEQGHDEYWEMNLDIVSRILDDRESMEHLLENELSDLRGELYNIHHNAYNSAYETKVFDDVWKELEEYFIGNGEWISIPHPYKKNTTLEKFKIEINNLEKIVNDYLFENKDYGNSGTLEYQGNLISIIMETYSCLSVRASDYPDSTKVSENINSYFSDYI